MWHSARSKFSYPKRDYKANLGIQSVGLSAIEQNAVNSLKNMGGRLGRPSTFGSVVALGDKYALKTMNFSETANQSDNLKIFLNEVKVGGMRGIQKVGPRIYAWRVIRNSQGVATEGEYIMDSFTQGNKDVVSTSLHEFVRNILKVCPAPTHPLVVMLKETLKNFYLITQGYHGDLHTGNIAVVYNPTTLEIKRVIIFDYGSHKRLKSKVKAKMCLEEIFEAANKEYKKSFAKYKANYKFPQTTSVNVYYPNRSQPRRSNVQILKAIDPKGMFFNKFQNRLGAKSIYNLISNHPRNISNFNTSFVSPMVFAKQTGTRPKNLLIREFQKKKYPQDTKNQVERRLINRFAKFGNQLYSSNERNILPGISLANYKTMFTNLLKGKIIYNKKKELISKREPTATNENIKKAIKSMNAASLKLTNEEHKMLMNYIS